MAPTPSNNGYWILRSGGQVYPFGDAMDFGDFVLPEYPLFSGTPDPAAAIFANPISQGYRVVTRSGATFPFGEAPGGSEWAEGFSLETDPSIVCPSGIMTFELESFDPTSSFGTWSGSWTGTLRNESTGSVFVLALDATIVGESTDTSFGSFGGDEYSITLAPDQSSSVEGLVFGTGPSIELRKVTIDMAWEDEGETFYSIYCPLPGFEKA